MQKSVGGVYEISVYPMMIVLLYLREDADSLSYVGK
jgi:hypothetical protein